MNRLYQARNANTLAGMDAILAENRTHFSDQVALFKPGRLQRDKDRIAAKGGFSDHDTIIAIRIRPLLEAEKEAGHVAGVFARGRDDYADVHELRNKVTGRPVITTTSFQFDRTYGPDSTSEHIYRDLLAPLIPWAWGGGISTLFAYGQTGSGKTYTVGSLAKQAAEHLFSGLVGKRDVHLSCFELAGNVALDLLNDKHMIRVMEDSFGEVQLVGALEPRVRSATELLHLIDSGMSSRKSTPTLKNDASSRTHAICKIRIVNNDVCETPDGIIFLIDLAGSEAASDVKDHSQERMKETKDINTSLSVLKDCIRGRCIWYIEEAKASAAGTRVKQSHIPFRNNTLTKVLKHVFDTQCSRHCKTSVIACVGSSYFDAGAAKNTFRYAELLSVPVPPFKAPAHNDKIPTTWGPAFVKKWIRENSGNPAVDGSILAPTENGIQLCRIPAGEFVSRCLRTPGVNEKHARAFHQKLIALHIDSRAAISNQSLGPEQEIKKVEELKAKIENAKPFFQRLQAGMFVQLKQISPTQAYLPIYMILSPELGFSRMYSDGLNTPGHEAEAYGKGDKAEFGKGTKGKRYICCVVEPSPMPNTYEIDVRRQNLIEVRDMEKEILMEYDRGTRFYYMTV